MKSTARMVVIAWLPIPSMVASCMAPERTQTSQEIVGTGGEGGDSQGGAAGSGGATGDGGKTVQGGSGGTIGTGGVSGAGATGGTAGWIELGYPCVSSAECKSGHCYGYFTGKGYCTTSCSSKSECATGHSGMICSTTNPTGECRSTCNTDADCTTLYGPTWSCNNDVATDGSVRGTCWIWQNGTSSCQCRKDSQCASGLCASAGYCFVQCSHNGTIDDSLCDSDSYCQMTSWHCVPACTGTGISSCNLYSADLTCQEELSSKGKVGMCL